MKKQAALLTILFFSSLFISCKQTEKPDDDYKYYKETLTQDGVGIEFSGKGYGTYGQLLPTYCEGSISSIFDPNSSITISTSSHDNSSTSVSEVYLTLTLNKHINTLVTSFDTTRTNQVSLRIVYKDENDKEVYITSSYNPNKTYTINKYVKTIKLTVTQQKYFSSTSAKDPEQVKYEPTKNKFTIKQFLPQ